MADTSTLTFVAVLAATYVAVRWYLNSGAPSTSSPGSRRRPGQGQQRRRRPVTQDMIDVVQALGPTLSADQIRYDLERTGSVEETVEKYLSTGTLPQPPGGASSSASSSRASGSSSRGPTGETSGRPSASNSPTPSTSTSGTASRDNLISQYGLSAKVDTDEAMHILEREKDEIKWSASSEERQAQLRKQQQDMILRARRKLELKKAQAQ